MKVLMITGVFCAFVSVACARNFPPLLTNPSGRWSEPIKYVRVPYSISVQCQASAQPPAKYYWTFNGTRIEVNENILSFDENDGTLTTGSFFGRAYSGDYQCIAYNDEGASMTSVLKILAAFDAPFQGQETVKNVPVYVSKYIKLECQNVPESVPWWTFKWTKGTSTDKASFLPLTLDDRMIIDDKGSLHFLWTEMSDAGFYACAITNDVFLSTYRSTQIINLMVNSGVEDDRGPELKYTQDVQVYAGQNATLLCIFSYYSKVRTPMQVNWLYGGEKVGKGPNITLTKVLLPNITQNQEGEYLCEATLGTKQAIGRVNLKIVSPPTFNKGRELETRYVPVDKDAVFHCGTSSHNTYSKPPVWLVNGVPLLGCPERFFECKQTLDNPEGYSQCIPEKKNGRDVVCNNDPSDCTDGSDEENCFVISCPESQKQCRDKCVPESTDCEKLQCDYPDFLCYDELACVAADKICDQRADCRDGSDEIACSYLSDIKRSRFSISSDRTELTLPRVKMTDSMCFQCMVTNEYGTTIGDGCLTVIDKIEILKGPNSTYDVEPDTRVEIIMKAKTDINWQNQMNYTWWWYEEITDENTGEKHRVPKELPPTGNKAVLSFYLSQQGKNMTIVFPAVPEDDDDAFDIYNILIDRIYTVIIQHRFDKVELNFTINGKEIVKPVPVIEKASTNLWFIAIIVGVLLLFLVVVLIICYMYRNRGGTYMLDKKEQKAGHNPEKELEEGGFHDVGRVDDEDDLHGDKASLSESVQPYESDDDPTEEYGGDFDGSKFNEEGSFIGAYGDKRKEATV